jgi:hypothetical protein
MKKHRITRKKKTLKKYSKAQFRRLNKQTIKMKGGTSKYIKYREEQLKRAQSMLLELIQTNSGSRLLKGKLEKLIHLLTGHIRSASSSEFWNDRGEHIDIAISEINNLNHCIRHDVEPIPIINYEPPLMSNTNICANFEDKSDENYRDSIPPIPISQRRTIRSAKKSIAKSIKKKHYPSRRIINSRGT